MATEARSIKLSVGRNGVNNGKDVMVVQTLLNAALEREPKLKATGIKKLETNGECDAKTIAAIQAFQEKVMGWSGRAVDATVDPKRATWKALNGNVASVGQVKKVVAPPPTEVAGYKAFKQGDAQWRAGQLGEGSRTIWGHGCALCSLTMAATVIGSPTKPWLEYRDDLEPKNLTPPHANAILRKAGAFNGSSLIMPRAAEALGMSYEEYGRAKDLKPEDVALIDCHLTYGYPVAANLDYKGSAAGDHWILIVQRFGDYTFGSIDPSYGRELRLTAHPQCAPGTPQFTREENIKRGVLYGLGMGGTASQQQYVVVRFALLSPASGGICSAA
jgi:hypothetical protein